jgi:hypothetical protein
MIRKVVVPNENPFPIFLPDSYMGREVEITATFMFEREMQALRKKTLRFDEFSIDTTGFKFDREEANAR